MTGQTLRELAASATDERACLAETGGFAQAGHSTAALKRKYKGCETNAGQW
jgi:hypothetical protein